MKKPLLTKPKKQHSFQLKLIVTLRIPHRNLTEMFWESEVVPFTRLLPIYLGK